MPHIFKKVLGAVAAHAFTATIILFWIVILSFLYFGDMSKEEIIRKLKIDGQHYQQTPLW